MLDHMLQKRRKDVASEVARKLAAAEIDTDTALSSTAELMMLLPSARKNMRIAAEEIQDMLVRLTASWDSMVIARGEMMASHRAMAVTRDRFHLTETGWGGLGEKPAIEAVEDVRAAA